MNENRETYKETERDREIEIPVEMGKDFLNFTFLLNFVIYP